MFAANLQHNWLSSQKTTVTFIFCFLKLYNFCSYQTFVGLIGSELQRFKIAVKNKPQFDQNISIFKYNSFDVYHMIFHTAIAN